MTGDPMIFDGPSDGKIYAAVSERLQLSEMAKLHARIERLKSALIPFSQCADVADSVAAPDGRGLMFTSEGGGTFLGFASVFDLRNARAALNDIDK